MILFLLLIYEKDNHFPPHNAIGHAFIDQRNMRNSRLLL